MSKGDRIIIAKASNGFIVQPDSGLNVVVPLSETFVFETLVALQVFVTEHFTNTKESSGKTQWIPDNQTKQKNPPN